jgi:hypothetical protein
MQRTRCDPGLGGYSHGTKLRTVCTICTAFRSAGQTSLLICLAEYDDIMKKCDESPVQATARLVNPGAAHLILGRGEFSVTFSENSPSKKFFAVER